MPRRGDRVAWLWLSAWVCALSSTAVQAGPVELLDGVSISPSDPDSLVVTYQYGGSGLFVSEDGGATLKWLCSTGASLPASNSGLLGHASGDGSIYLGSFHGLWRGDKSGCGFQPLPELDKKLVRAIAGDPFDAKRTYVVTANGMADNGIYMNDGSGSLVPLGKHARMFIDSLHVVKNGEARRFYETGTTTNVEANTVTYTIRVSDDEGETWSEEAFDPTQFESTEQQGGDFTIVAVDPTDPNRIVGLVARPDRAEDALVFSAEKGKAGTWKPIAAPALGGAVTFGSDGVLYFGDNNFASRGLFKVERLGEPPQLISGVYRISCLRYDAARSRLLGCADNYRFGAFDTRSGELTTLLDLRCAEHAVECADRPEIQSLCQPPGAGFCKLDHWVIAPLCCVYERDEFAAFAAAQNVYCEAGVAKQKPGAAGEGGAPPVPPPCGLAALGGGGAGGVDGAAAGSGSAGAGARGVAGAAVSGGDGARKAGCSCSTFTGSSPTRAALLGWLGLVGSCVARYRRRRPQRRSMGLTLRRLASCRSRPSAR